MCANGTDSFSRGVKDVYTLGMLQGVVDKRAFEVIDAQLKRGINNRSKRLKCIQHIEVELDGIDGCSDLDLNKWKR